MLIGETIFSMHFFVDETPHWLSLLSKKRTITSQVLWSSVKKHLSNNLQDHTALYYFVSSNAIFLCVQVILYTKTHFLFSPSIGHYQYYFNILWSFNGSEHFLENAYLENLNVSMILRTMLFILASLHLRISLPMQVSVNLSPKKSNIL